jgi:hypothetical protein
LIEEFEPGRFIGGQDVVRALERDELGIADEPGQE